MTVDELRSMLKGFNGGLPVEVEVAGTDMAGTIEVLHIGEGITVTMDRVVT